MDDEQSHVQQQQVLHFRALQGSYPIPFLPPPASAQTTNKL